MSVHEHVSMSLLRDAGVPTPKFGLATTAAEAKQIAEDLDTKDLVIKAQVSNLREKIRIRSGWRIKSLRKNGAFEYIYLLKIFNSAVINEI